MDLFLNQYGIIHHATNVQMAIQEGGASAAHQHCLAILVNTKELVS